MRINPVYVSYTLEAFLSEKMLMALPLKWEWLADSPVRVAVHLCVTQHAEFEKNESFGSTNTITLLFLPLSPYSYLPLNDPSSTAVS